MYDYQPSENDVQPMRAWLAVMEKGHLNLTRYENLDSLLNLRIVRYIRHSVFCAGIFRNSSGSVVICQF